MTLEFKSEENGMSIELEYGKLNISGNADNGFRPFQLLVASIASCSAMVFRKILTKQRISIDDLKVTADGERNEEEANRVERMTLSFVVYGNQLNEKRLQKNLMLARKNCAMIRSVEGSIDIQETLLIVNTTN